MNKTLIGVLVVVIVAGAGWYWYSQKNNADTFGTYAYSCDNGVKFDMTLSSTISSVVLKAQGNAPFTEVTLDHTSGTTYATENGEIALVGSGEEIQLTVGAANMTCNPVPNGDNAPFNWGGAGEGTQ